MPWHGAHLAKTTLPAAIDSGVEAIGFFIFAASGLPWAEVTIRAAQASASAAKRVGKRRECTRFLLWKMSAHSTAPSIANSQLPTPKRTACYIRPSLEAP